MDPIGKNMMYIDIVKVINESNSALLKRLPHFVVQLIAKIVRQDELNTVLNKYSDCEGVDFLDRIIEEFNLTLEVEGKENLPENGRCFFASNHPFGIIDGLVLTHTVHKKYGSLKAIANDGFMFIPQLRPLIAEVDVFDGSSKEYIVALDKIYNSDIPITHFPAGEVSRRYKGKVQDAEWQKSFINKSISSRRDIVPIYFSGTNSRLFYAVHTLRCLLGIKLNLELMLLPSEMFKKRNATIRVRIGKPIPYQQFDKSLSHRAWAQKVRSFVYEMAVPTSPENFKNRAL